MPGWMSDLREDGFLNGRLRVTHPVRGYRAGADAVRALIAELTDDVLLRAVRNLGGHDHDALRAAFAEIDDSRPTVILAYTIKGRGLPTEGHPQNHSAMLTIEEFDEFAATLGMDVDNPWLPFDPASRSGLICAAAAERLRREPVTAQTPPDIPADIGRTPSGTSSTAAT